MSERESSRPSWVRRLFRPWYAKALLLLVLLLAVAYAVAPQQVTQIITVDQMYKWAEDFAPPRYEIVWQPAERVEAPAPDLTARDSLIRPQLAEDGTALYFTRRKPDGTADIYRCKLLDGQWQPAEPVEQLNTEVDDVGPVIRADGKRLYLYSNREGGYGGFDLYVCDHTPDGWSEPRNLGPHINSPAHEYDPAVSADGTRLFFSSNRTPKLIRRIAEGTAGEFKEEWTTTLRADLGLNKFDLYMARRATADEPWSIAKSLKHLNHPQANEGAPYIGPNGVFLYFVSDRNVRLGEDVNFDIYRAKIRGEKVYDADNLGSGVNTAANEIEPALSPEGFRLFFSRNLPPEPQQPRAEQPLPGLQYALYCSEAMEVIEETGWGQSYLGKFFGFLARNWWWLAALLLTLAFLAALLWYLREVSLRRLPVPGFLLIALLVHVLMGLSSFYVYFGEEIVQQIKKEFEEIVFATNMSSDSLHQSHEPGQESYEKVADLQALETVEPTDVARQQTEIPNVPVPSDSPVPQIPTRLQREMPPDRLVAAPPEIQPEITQDVELTRRLALDPMLEEQRVEIEQTEAVEQTRQERLEQMQVAVARLDSAPPPAAAPKMLRRRVVDPAVQLEREMVTVERTTDQPVPSKVKPDPSLERVVRAVAQTDVGPQVQTEELAAPVTGPKSQRQPEHVVVVVAHRELAAGLAGLPTLRRRTTVDTTVQLQREDVTAERIAEEPVRINLDQRPTTLERAIREIAAPAAAPQVETEELVAAAPQGGRATEGSPAQVEVEVERRQPSTQIASLPTLHRGPISEAAPRLQSEAIEAERVGHLPADLAMVTASRAAVGERRRAAPSLETDHAKLIEAIAAAAKPAARKTRPIKGVQVGVERPDAGWTVARVKTAGEFAGKHNPRKHRLIVGSLEKETVDAPPSFSPHASRITRRPARAPMLMYAEDNIGLQAMFRMRHGDAKRDVVAAFGGSDKTLEAVRRGLAWLDQHQHDDGFWSFNKFYNEREKIPGNGNVQNDVGATGFALLPFLGDGHTHLEGKYQSTVRDAVGWLIEQQTDKGELKAKNTGGNTRMYSHAIATIAMCEAYGMTKDQKLREPAQKAIDFIVSAQHEPSGGWRYEPNQAADTSVVGWQMMALKSGQMAALKVPQRPLTLLEKWLRSVEGQGANIGRFGYQNRGSLTPPMTAEGLLCLQYMGVDRNDKRLLSGARYLLENLPGKGEENSYYWYYATQVMFHLQGDMWQQWNDALRDMLVNTQVKSGHLAGTWNPSGKWEDKGGRIYGTSLKLLMLEVYYRHLPLYQVIQQ